MKSNAGETVKAADLPETDGVQEKEKIKKEKIKKEKIKKEKIKKDKIIEASVADTFLRSNGNGRRNV